MMRAMFVLVRDEDPPTVAAAVRAFAEEEGLEPVESETKPSNPLEALALLGGPQVLIAQATDQVFVGGLESLDIFDAQEWGEQLSLGCEAEVLVVDPASDGVRVYVFDEGELEDTIEILLDPSGRTKSPELAELTDSEAGAKELTAGIVASGIEQLLPAVLRCLGVESNPEGALSLVFHDPLGDDEEEQEPGLIVEPLPAAELVGRVGSDVASPHGSAFAVVLIGVDSLTGVRLELTGSALDLVAIDEIQISLRAEGANELSQRTLSAKDGELVFDLPDAYLERVDFAAPTIDMTDLFSSMQRMMSSGESQVLNTLTVFVSGIGRAAGEGELTLEASPLEGDLAGAEASIPVRVVIS